MKRIRLTRDHTTFTSNKPVKVDGVDWDVQLCSSATTKLLDLPRGAEKIELVFTKRPPKQKTFLEFKKAKIKNSRVLLMHGTLEALKQQYDKGYRYVYGKAV